VTKWRELDLLSERLNAQTIRRTKEAVFGYNLSAIFQPIQYDLDPKHRKLYDRLLEEQLLLLPSGEKIDATTSQRLYHQMQQIVCNWHEFSGDDTNRSAIYDLVDNVIEDTQCLDPSKSKLIIFTHYKRTSRNMLEYLGPAAVGAYSEVNSQKSIERFLNDPACRILVGQPSSCGVGLNPAHLCSEVLFAEFATVPMLMNQAIGRVERKGQTVRPTVRFAKANGTVQHHLYRRLMDNDELVAKVEQVKSLRDRLRGI
jgi:SNF2 family DNA or RNA helicase